jgi:lipopolysaccharide cholinephosphotransferase
MMDKEPMPGEVWPLKHKIFLKFFEVTHIDKIISTKWVWKKLDHVLQTYDYDQADHLINYMGFWELKEWFPKDKYGEGTYYQFEDIKLKGPDDYNYVLTQMYGDYMTPPSDDMKDHHMIEFVDE